MWLYILPNPYNTDQDSWEWTTLKHITSVELVWLYTLPNLYNQDQDSWPGMNYIKAYNLSRNSVIIYMDKSLQHKTAKNELD